MQVEILQFAKAASRRCQRQFVGGQPVDWMQVVEGGINPPNVLLAQRATDIQVKRRQWDAMIDDTNTADDNEFQSVVLKSREQSLVILRHDFGLLLVLPTKNQ